MDIKLAVFKLARKIKLEWKKADIKGLIQFTVKIIYATTIAGITWQIIT